MIIKKSGVVIGANQTDTKTLNYQTTQCNSTKVKVYDTLKKKVTRKTSS